MGCPKRSAPQKTGAIGHKREGKNPNIPLRNHNTRVLVHLKLISRRILKKKSSKDDDFMLVFILVLANDY